MIRQSIMKMALDAVNASSPLRYVEAEVVSVSPISIRLKSNSKLVIPNGAVIVPEYLKRHTRQVRIGGVMQTVEFMDKLNNGDRVMVAVVQGGQSFFIIDRI